MSRKPKPNIAEFIVFSEHFKNLATSKTKKAVRTMFIHSALLVAGLSICIECEYGKFLAPKKVREERFKALMGGTIEF